VVALSIACSDAPVACTLAPRYAVRLTVRDAATGEPLANGAHIELSGSGFTDTMTVSLPGGPNSAGSVLIGENRSGSVTLRITRAGYRPWERVLSVERDACGARTVDVVAALDGVTVSG
jgi:hypothetical protein